MSRLVPRSTQGRVLAAMALIGAAAFFTLFLVQTAHAAPYTNPFWANNSPSVESALSYKARLGKSPEGVDVRTGELFWSFGLLRTPGLVGDNRLSLRWRSMISGSTQLGNGMLPSWEVTTKKRILNQQDPNGPSGHEVDVRRSSGRIDTYRWDGSAYQALDPEVMGKLAIVAGGLATYQPTATGKDKVILDANGMPWGFEDRNGNLDRYAYNASYQLTSYTDERGKVYSFSHGTDGRLTLITDFAQRSWGFTYDTSGNLKTITSPPTEDQPSGIVTTLTYDGANRLTAVTDGRGNTDRQFAYDGAGRVATVTIDGNAVTYSYSPGVTTRTDRNGNVHLYHHSGNRITKTEMMVGAQPKYTTLFRWNGIHLANIVLPRGNRIDFTWDARANLIGRRHRTQDTGTNDPSDVVHVWTHDGNDLLVSYMDPRGSTTTYGRDTAGNVTTITLPNVGSPVAQSASVAMTYNGFGQRLTRVDEEGTTTQYSYFATGNAQGLLSKVEVDPAGLDLETSFTYDTAGNVVTRTDPRGNSWTYTWDNVRRLTQSQAPAPLSYKVKREYDGNGNLTKKQVENIDKDGNQVVAHPWITTVYTYTNTDDPKTIVEDIDASTTRTTTLDYDQNQNRIRVTLPEGNKQKWEYDERDLIVKWIRGEGDAKASDVQYAYDLNGNRITLTDGRSNDTDSTFDLFDRRTKITNALGHYTESTFDKNGNATKIQKKDGANAELQREDYFFDTRNRLWKTSKLFKDPSQTYSDAVTTIERFKTGQLKKLTDPRGKVTTIARDAAHRKTKTTDAMGNEWSWTLDDNGNPTAWSIAEKDGTNTVTHDYEATYDALNRRSTHIEIDRNTTSNRWTTKSYFDSRSNLVFLEDAENNPTRWTFDGLSRMIKRERALTVGATNDNILTAQVTQWGFDKNNRLISHKDDGPNDTTWAFDALDRATLMTYPDANTVAYVHDANDNVTKVTDPAGNVVDDVFDVLNRNTSRTVTRATGFLGTTSESRTYDALNRIVLNSDNDYKVEYEFAVIGLGSHVYKTTQSYVGGTAYAKSVTKTYDAAGNRLTEVYPAGANLSLGYTSNDINNLASISDGTNTLATYSYIGLRKKITTYQSGATRTNSYTGFRNELGVVHHQASAPATIIQLEYGYNKVHDRTFERFGASGSGGEAFAYDKMRRLTSAWMGSSNPSSPVGNSYVQRIDYNYDDDGNRNSVVVTPYQQTAATTNYTTNSLNEYTAVGGTTHTWDANGNLTDNGTFKLKYNYKNLIVEVRNSSDSSLVASYRYDAEGRRVEKDVGGDKIRFIRSRIREASTSAGPGGGGRYDMAHVIATYDGSNNWLQNFVFSDDVDAVQVLEQKDLLDYDSDGNTTEITRSFYHRNALGSVMEITDLNEAAVVSYRYDPYGKVTITRGGQAQSSDPLGNHWHFTGRYFDEESGLYYYRARSLDPALGRFLQRDPLGYAEGPNLFEYVDSTPLNATDASGLGPSKKVVIWMHPDKKKLHEAVRFLIEEVAKHPLGRDKLSWLSDTIKGLGEVKIIVPSEWNPMYWALDYREADALHFPGSSTIYIDNDHYENASVRDLAITIAVEVLHLSFPMRGYPNEGWTPSGGYSDAFMEDWAELLQVVKVEIPKFNEAWSEFLNKFMDLFSDSPPGDAKKDD